MCLLRYAKDARSIPVSGDSSNVIGIGTSAVFAVQDHKLQFVDPENGNVNVEVGTHIQYTVNLNQ